MINQEAIDNLAKTAGIEFDICTKCGESHSVQSHWRCGPVCSTCVDAALDTCDKCKKQKEIKLRAGHAVGQGIQLCADCWKDTI